MKRSALFIILIVLGIIGAALGYAIFGRTSNKAPASETQYVAVARNQRGFTDGLNNPSSVTEYTLDEMGAGIASREVFNARKDGMRITRTRYENGTDHFYFQYKIELNTANGFRDITPIDFRTVEGAECALQKFQFVFVPEFQVIKISRPWQNTWTTPTMAMRTVYKLENNELKATASRQLHRVCNVSELFE
jgi:hypothetical protein